MLPDSTVEGLLLCSDEGGPAGAGCGRYDAEEGAIHEDRAHVQEAQARQEAPRQVAQEVATPP